MHLQSRQDLHFNIASRFKNPVLNHVFLGSIENYSNQFPVDTSNQHLGSSKRIDSKKFGCINDVFKVEISSQARSSGRIQVLRSQSALLLVFMRISSLYVFITGSNFRRGRVNIHLSFQVLFRPTKTNSTRKMHISCVLYCEGELCLAHQFHHSETNMWLLCVKLRLVTTHFENVITDVDERETQLSNRCKKECE